MSICGKGDNDILKTRTYTKEVIYTGMLTVGMLLLWQYFPNGIRYV